MKMLKMSLVFVVLIGMFVVSGCGDNDSESAIWKKVEETGKWKGKEVGKSSDEIETVLMELHFWRRNTTLSEAKDILRDAKITSREDFLEIGLAAKNAIAWQAVIDMCKSLAKKDIVNISEEDSCSAGVCISIIYSGKFSENELIDLSEKTGANKSAWIFAFRMVEKWKEEDRKGI